MFRCENCGLPFPEVTVVTKFGTQKDVCAICALEIRNTDLGKPKHKPFTDLKSHAMFCRAVHFLGTLAPPWAREVADGDRGIEPIVGKDE